MRYGYVLAACCAMLFLSAAHDVRAASLPRNPTDPLTFVISLDEQRLQAWRGLQMIAETTISSGKAGFETPTGIFSVLHKSKFHRSNIYSNAPMPWMQRLTWTGIALHQGVVPNRPASHGCVRLPDENAQTLFDLSATGVHVVINPAMLVPRPIINPGLPQPVPESTAGASTAFALNQFGDTASDALPEPAASVESANSAALPLRVLITRRDRRGLTREAQAILKQLGHYSDEVDGLTGSATAAALKAFQQLHGLAGSGIMDGPTRASLYKTIGTSLPSTGQLLVRQGFEPLFEAPIAIDAIEQPLGTHLFTVTSFERTTGKTGWQVLTLANRLDSYTRAINEIAKEGTENVEAEAALARIKIPPGTMARIAQLLTPGSSIAISDTGLGPYTGWKTDFVITTKY